MIDLHSHLLPGVDDGSRSVEQSIRTLARLRDDGYVGLALTPHLLASRMAQGLPERFNEAYQRLRAVAPAVPTLHRGVELMLDTAIPETESFESFTLGGSRYLLVEFPPAIHGGAASQLLDGITRQGLIPVVAHPERYAACSPEQITGWRALGAKMQCDGTTITRDGSRGTKARALLRAGLVDLLAADNHGDVRSLGTARQYLEEHGASGEADVLLVQNPSAVIENRAMLPPPAVVLKRRWNERVSGWLRGGAG